MVNIMAADDLVMSDARSSAAIDIDLVLLYYSILSPRRFNSLYAEFCWGKYIFATYMNHR